jgi:hypothetical protein
MVAVGIVGILAPSAILTLTGPLLTLTALYVIAAIRIAFGLILLGTAGRSRAPMTLRVLGGFILLAGIVTPIVGVERSREAVAWWSSHGFLFMRATMASAVVLGAFLIWAVVSRGRPSAGPRG